MTRKRQSTRVFKKLTRALVILVVLILVSDCWPQMVRSDDGVDTSTRHGRKKLRKGNKLKTTTSGFNSGGGGGAGFVVDTSTEMPVLLDDKKLSASGEMSSDEMETNKTAGDPVHHFPSPFVHSKEKLNQTHANMFQHWLDSKSDELYEMSMNFSGYKLLNETYNLEIRNDAQFAWINFTSMIMNISNTISEVLYNKTLIVKKLSDLVEATYDDYRNDSDQIEESASFVYYDSKSPKTFCDIQDAVRLKRNLTEEEEGLIEDGASREEGAETTLEDGETLPMTTTMEDERGSGESYEELKFTESPDVMGDESGGRAMMQKGEPPVLAAQQYLMRVAANRQQEDLQFRYQKSALDVVEPKNVINAVRHQGNKKPQEEYIEYAYWADSIATTNKAPTKPTPATTTIRTTTSCFNSLPFFPTPQTFSVAHRRHNNSNNRQRHRRVKRQAEDGDGTSEKKRRRKGPGGRNRTRGGAGGKRRKTTTAAPILMYDEDDTRQDLDFYDDYFMMNVQEKPFWNITCMNRSFDENFKNFPKGVNRNKSTIHVPINVYKQDMTINMTAYWTEALDKQFQNNYDEDNELFWQYFCSSHGLLRRYPGALWTVPHREDFFDCRLQSWYIMAAASPKDVIILMDSSGSMTGLRLEIAKKLIESIMDTLSDNDFFNILTYSNTVNYLMDLKNETDYRGRFIQAGKANKQRFMEKLKDYKNTHEVANLNDALNASFNLLLDENLESESCKCNKVIMVITDGSSENAEEVFKKYNWDNGRRVRVFTFLIGRDNVDPRQVQWMACANDGKFFHVATIADVNEHVHEYIPVLSRPMALLGSHDTTWSNVFIGHLDKELKIAVARPAFKTKDSLLSKTRTKFVRNPIAKIATTTASPIAEEYEYEYEYEYEDYYYDEDEENAEVEKTTPKPKVEMTREQTEKFEHLIEEALGEQSVLLGVVGVDVPVLRLISKVSPKFQMGVGIYLMMIDNNGFIVYHPSIKRELQNAAVDSKGTSQSIDIEKFEIPISNEEAFQKLEHEMIDEKTNNITLENWKREGLRVTKRYTEYVYTSVANSPFSVAIASPNSFGRFYIDLPPHKESKYSERIEEIVKEGNVYETLISVYNCSYTFTKLTSKITHPNKYSDFCISYLFQDTSQVLAIKSDLVLHDIFYNIFNFTVFDQHPNLVRSSFYGTFSGITFHLPVKFSREPPPVEEEKGKKKKGRKGTKTETTTTSTTTTSTTTTTTTQSTSTEYNVYGMTEPLSSEMTINAELASPFWQWPPYYSSKSGGRGGWSSRRPIHDRPFERPKPLNNSRQLLNLNLSNDTYYSATNMFNSESQRHTYSFEKEYYTRSIEFSDYMRNSHNHSAPIAVYFLNDTSDLASRRDTVSATLPIWLDKVPTAVAGVSYDARLFQKFLFENFMMPGCEHESCRNLCSRNRGMNVTCYLVDEHGIIVLSTMERLLPKFYKERDTPMGKPLQQVNPWLMKQLEYSGIYNLVIPGHTLPECRKTSEEVNSASQLASFIALVVNHILAAAYQFFQYSVHMLMHSLAIQFTASTGFFLTPAQAQLLRNPTLAERIENFNNDWRIQNSNCYYFGIYSFNITKWKSLEASEFRVWCNSTAGSHLGVGPTPRRYLAGYVHHSNLLMLVVEDEFELIHCGNMSEIMRKHTDPPQEFANGTNGTTNSTMDVKGDLLVDLDSSDQANEDTHDYGVIRLEDFNTNYILGNWRDNMSNASFANASMMLGPYEPRKPDFHINRYRRRPSYCHSIFLNEKEFLPCSSASRQVNFLATITTAKQTMPHLLFVYSCLYHLASLLVL